MSKKLVPFIVLAIFVATGLGAFLIATGDDDDETEQRPAGQFRETADATQAPLPETTEDVNLFLSYIPSVQFAPLYVAFERGYFQDEGINITFEHSYNETDGIDRLAVNDLQFGIISGEQVIIARQAEKPLVYVMEWYEKFPVGVVYPADSDIELPEDLAGKQVGYPGPFGASYMGLRALLTANDLDESDLELSATGFSAPEMMCTEQVEAAVVYVVNEPLTISRDCFPVEVFEISNFVDLVANGLVTNERTIRDNPELIEGMIHAILRGVAATIEDPDTAFELSLFHVTDLPEDQYETQKQVLLNSIELWRSENPGYTMPDAWQTTQNVLLSAGLLSAPLDNLEAAYSNEFLPAPEEGE